MVGKKKPEAASAMDEEESFPRGGGQGLAPVVQKRLEREAYAEAEAELFGAKNKGKKRKQAAAVDEQDEEDAFFSSMDIQGKQPKYAELLKFKSLSIGTKLWAAVVEITPHSLMVSLPHGLKGHVAYTQASDYLAELSKKQQGKAGKKADAQQAQQAQQGGQQQVEGGPLLTELFSIGQLVRCTVVGLEGGADDSSGGNAGAGGKKRKKRVQLSLLVARANEGLGVEGVKEGAALPACVRSVEDHGYLLTFGIKGTRGFLPKKAAPAPLAAGALVEAVVERLGPGGAAVVGCGQEALAGAVAREWEGLTIGSLQPGALVAARVRSVLSDGLLVSFLTFFSGTIDPFHLGVDPGTDWKKHFSPNQRVKARILYVDPASKRVGLTLAKHLLAFSLPHNFPLLGQVFEEAVVRRVDPALGLLCSLPPAPGGGALTPGYAHISALDDSKVEDLTKRFRPGQAVKCRVTGFRPLDGLAVLALKPSVVEQDIVSYADVRPGMPLGGTVVKVEDFGLLVSITPTVRAMVPTIHMSDLGTKKAHKKFKEGQKVAGRVLAVDPSARKLTLTLKPALLGSKLPPITRLQDAAVGGRSHGVVTGVKDFGVFVSFYGGVSGLAHASECGLAPGQKPTEAFELGQVVKCRVLAHDPAHKGLKLSLVSKKAAKAATAAEPATNASAAEPDAAAAAAAGAAVPAGPAAAAAQEGDGLGGIQPGDIVSATVKSVQTKEVGGEAVPHHVELEISLAPTDGCSSNPSTVVKARLDAAHLADHPAAAAALWGALKPGAALEGLLVLQRLETSKTLRLTRKASIVAAAAALPRSFADVAEGALLPGYVASVTPDAVFVRFLGGVTGRAGLAQLSDTFVSDPHLHFGEGQSVRAQVVQVDRERERFSVTLKQSLCGGPDAAYLASYFRDLELASELGGEPGAGAEHDWAADFPIGSTVRATVDDVKEYGTLCDLEGHPDVVGLAAPHQVPEGGVVEAGHSVQAVVLDVNKKDGVVDLSLLPALLDLSAKAQQRAQQGAGGKKKRRKIEKGAEATATAAGGAGLQQGQELQCQVQLAKSEEGYCVVSLPLPEEGAQPLILGFLPTSDYNLSRAPPPQHPLAVGDTVRVKVAALPSPATCGRLLLHTPLDPRSLKAATAQQPQQGQQLPQQPGGRQRQGAQGQGQKSAGKGSEAAAAAKHPKAGDVVAAVVDAVHAVHAEATLEGATGCRGRLHICEAGAELWPTLAPGSKVQAVVLGRIASAEGRRHGVVELCALPSTLAAAKADPPGLLPKPLGWGAIKEGQQLDGFVQEVSGDSVWCVFSPLVRGRAFLAHAAAELDQQAEQGQHAKRAQQEGANAQDFLQTLFKPGQPAKAHVVSVDNTKRWLEVSLVGLRHPPRLGDALIGRVVGVDGSGVRVQIGGRSLGKAALTDLHDSWVDNALLQPPQPQPGQLVRARVVGEQQQGDKGQFLLSLRPSAVAGGGEAAAVGAREATAPPETLAASELKPGQQVSGYVKAGGPAGVFVCLARNCEARVRLGQLADAFVDNPAAAFPPGKKVTGRVLKVEGDRVELSLKSRGRPGAALEGLEEGAVVRGRVKRAEKFGVFVELDSGATGLAHVSELADEYVKDVSALFSVGQRVVARVLKVDRQASRLSLGLKHSYFGDDNVLAGAASDEEGAEPDFDAEVDAVLGMEDGGESEEEDGLAGIEAASEDQEMLPGEGDDLEDVAVMEEGAGSGEDEEPFDLDEEIAAEEDDVEGMGSESEEY